MLYLVAVAGAVLASGIWNRDATIPIGFGIELPVNGLIRDAILIAVELALMEDHASSRSGWRTRSPGLPMQEVAILFAAIFITMIPDAGDAESRSQGPFAPLLSLVSTPDGKPVDAAYFWLTGVAVELPRQCADLSRVLQSRRRRRAER